MEALGISTTVLLGRFCGLLLGFTLHEWAHAYSAFRLGGWSALADHRRLTLDPRYHIDALGLILALLIGFGWAKPVPVNPSAFYPNERRDMMLTSIAGPIMNLLIAFTFGMLIRMMVVSGLLVELGFMRSGSRVVMGQNGVIDFLYEIIATIVVFNILLLLFNLIPLHPLDGWRVMLGLLPADESQKISRYEQHSMLLLILLILVGLGPFFNPLSPLFSLIYDIFEIITGVYYYI